MHNAAGYYRVERMLSEGRSWLAHDPYGRPVVLKILEEDCLMRGRLHPMVRDRLERIRELAHPGVANLYAVEELDGRACLVWEYVEGQTLEEYLVSSGARSASLVNLIASMRSSIERLHSLGLVHGAIHGRNVIVTADGQVKLTHVSPLLYADPGDDWSALEKMLESSEPGGDWKRQVGSGLRRGGRAVSERGPDRAGVLSRRAALLGAIVLAAAGLAAAWGLWHWANQRGASRVWPAKPPRQGAGGAS